MHTEIAVVTTARSEFVDITRAVEEARRSLGLTNGVLVVYIPHTTAGVTINENADPSVTADVRAALDRLVPWHASWSHTEGNAAAHVKAVLTGSSVSVPVSNGRLLLGQWQGIFFAEYDGPRNRRVIISAVT